MEVCQRLLKDSFIALLGCPTFNWNSIFRYIKLFQQNRRFYCPISKALMKMKWKIYLILVSFLFCYLDFLFRFYFQHENGIDLARDMIKCYNEGKVDVNDDNVGKSLLCKTPIYQSLVFASSCSLLYSS